MCRKGEHLLFTELHEPGGESCDLTYRAQDVISLFGVFT